MHLVESFAALRDLVGYVTSVAGRAPDRGFLLERYYDNDMTRWASVTVLGGEAVCAYRKRPEKVTAMAPGRFKVFDAGAQGGAVEPAEIDDAQRELAVDAAQVLGCAIIGFDMIATEDGPMIVDENTSPGNYPEVYAAFGCDPVEAFTAVALSALPTSPVVADR